MNFNKYLIKDYYDFTKDDNCSYFDAYFVLSPSLYAFSVYSKHYADMGGDSANQKVAL